LFAGRKCNKEKDDDRASAVWVGVFFLFMGNLGMRAFDPFSRGFARGQS
jgi:hypothetical protein